MGFLSYGISLGRFSLTLPLGLIPETHAEELRACVGFAGRGRASDRRFGIILHCYGDDRRAFVAQIKNQICDVRGLTELRDHHDGGDQYSGSHVPYYGNITRTFTIIPDHKAR